MMHRDMNDLLHGLWWWTTQGPPSVFPARATLKYTEAHISRVMRINSNTTRFQDPPTSGLPTGVWDGDEPESSVATIKF
jgi:hypothetical protein